MMHDSGAHAETIRARSQHQEAVLQLQKLQEELSAARADMLATRAEAAAADAKYKATVAQVTWACGGPCFRWILANFVPPCLLLRAAAGHNTCNTQRVLLLVLDAMDADIRPARGGSSLAAAGAGGKTLVSKNTCLDGGSV